MTRITAVKKSLLADLSEGWDETCFAYVRPATYDDMIAVDDAQLSKKGKPEQVAFQEQFVKDHWISGKIKIFENGEFKPADMEVDDCLASQPIADKLYADIIGVNLDPKDLAALKAAVAMSSLPNSGEQSTETPLSEDSVEPATQPSGK